MLRRLGRSLSSTLNASRLVRAGKNLRTAVIDRRFRRRDAAAGRRLAAELARRGTRHVAFSIAFNSPWVIELLTAAWQAHTVGLDLVVLDNSSDADARARHAAICERAGVPWLPLPPNPEWSPNRSHGIAMNWAWFNVVHQADLEIAGFIDHDCFPTAPLDIPALMLDRAVHGLYGNSTAHPDAWNLWAGYCFVRPAATVGRTIDFKHRIEYRLDTGGGNWHGFYRHLPPTSVGKAEHEWIDVAIGGGLPAVTLLRLDGSFIHLEGASYAEHYRDPARRERLVAVLRDRYLGGGPSGA
jgi:hypothetical protein